MCKQLDLPKHLDTFKQFLAFSDKHFWTASVSKDALKDAKERDESSRSGITLVIGCPLPSEIQKVLRDIREHLGKKAKDAIGCDVVNWRDVFSALHITIYGLFKPMGEPKKRDREWDTVLKAKPKIQNKVGSLLSLQLDVGGVAAIYGRGSGSIRIGVSECNEMNQIRKEIEGYQIDSTPVFSGRGYGEKCSHIDIGRFAPELEYCQKQVLKTAWEVQKCTITYKNVDIEADFKNEPRYYIPIPQQKPAIAACVPRYCISPFFSSPHPSCLRVSVVSSDLTMPRVVGRKSRMGLYNIEERKQRWRDFLSMSNGMRHVFKEALELAERLHIACGQA